MTDQVKCWFGQSATPSNTFGGKEQKSNPLQKQQMDSDKKRKHSEDPSPAKQVMRSPNRVRAAKISTHREISLFEQKCRVAYRKLMRDLNEQFLKKIQSIDVPTRGGRFFDISVLVHQNLLQCNDIESKFGRNDGYQIVTYGSDDSNQLGIPFQFRTGSDPEEKETEYPPTIIKTTEPKDLRGVRQVAAGGLHSMALFSNGAPVTWGCSDDGILGHPVAEAFESTPTEVTGFKTNDGLNEDRQIIMIAAGSSHCLYLSLNGNVYMHGMYKDADSGVYSDIADENATPFGCNEKPVHVFQLNEPAISITTSACANFSTAVLQSGTLVTWGFGNSGELARSADMTTPEKDGDYDVGRNLYTVQELDEKGNVVSTGPHPKAAEIIKEKFLRPRPARWAGSVPFPKKNVFSVACGACHLLVAAQAIGSKRSYLYSSGRNNYGQLGHGDKTSRHELTLVEAIKNEDIIMVAAGEHHSLALNIGGTKLFAFGRADYGQLGIGKTSLGHSEDAPRQVRFPEEYPPVIAHISAGGSHSMAISINNDLYSWGFGESRATGHPDTNNDTFFPKKVDFSQDIRDSKTKVYQAAGGSQHSVILTKSFRDD